MNQSTAQQLSRKVCLTISVILSGIFLGQAFTSPYDMGHELWLIQATGYTALGALFLSLLTTPLRRLIQFISSTYPHAAVWAAFRRSFGISAACFALIHAALTLTTYLQDSWPFILSSPYLRAGLTALTVLLLLLLTSFPKIVRLLHIRFWKQLHRLSYVAALFLFQHLMQSPFASQQLIVALFEGLILLGTLRLLPVRQ